MGVVNLIVVSVSQMVARVVSQSNNRYRCRNKQVTKEATMEKAFNSRASLNRGSSLTQGKSSPMCKGTSHL